MPTEATQAIIAALAAESAKATESTPAKVATPNSQPTESAKPAETELADNVSALEAAGDLTEANLQEQLNNYARSLREEFEQSQQQTDPENIEASTKQFARKVAPAALAQIEWLSRNADSESVMLSANKFLLAMAIDNSNREGDPVRDLLNRLAPPTEQSTNPNAATESTPYHD